MKDPLFDVSDKIVIVTGGLGQIGAELVKEFHRRDSKVAVVARSVSAERIEKVLGSELAKSGRIFPCAVDIQNKSEINAFLDTLEKKWGTPDVLVNNAGIDTQPSAPPEVSGPFEDFPEEVFREVVNVNLVGTFLMTQAVGRRMVLAKKSGSIINIGSIYGMAFIKPVAYSAAKSGIYNLTRYCATYWGKQGIRVNTFTPSGVFRDTQDKEFQANYCNRMPVGRMAQADEYNGAIIFLASNASKYMTGSNLVMDGGWTAW